MEDGGAPAKGSQPTTRRSSRSGGFKPKKPGRETYDGQGFGGAGRRRAAPPEEPVEEPAGVDIGVSEDDSEFDPNMAVPAEDGLEEGEGQASEGEGYEEEFEPAQDAQPPRRRGLSLGRRSTDDDEMTEEEFRAQQAAARGAKGFKLNGGGQKKAGKAPKQPKGKKEKSAPITLGKGAGMPAKKAGSKAAPAPIQPKKGITMGAGSKKATKAPPPPEDDFDEMFGNEAAPQGESIVSQVITIAEVAVGSVLAFFGASQLGYILINKIMSGG